MVRHANSDQDCGCKTVDKVHRRRIIQGIGGASVVGAAGCLGDDSDADGDTGGANGDDSESNGDASQGDEDELVVALPATIQAFDPIQITDGNTRSATGLIYERLFAIDFDLNPQPLLAESLENIDDTTVEINLREGVEFHNGDPFNASSVQASIERSIDTARDGFISPWYDSSEIIDEHTIRFNLLEPFSPLAAEMLPEIQMVPEGAANGDVDLSEEPIGTGPYLFDEHQEGSFFRVTRNDNYWYDGSGSLPPEPPIETITFRIIEEASTQESALRTGEVDVATMPPAASAQSLSEEDGIILHQITGGTFLDMHFPTEASPYSNEKVRRGITQLMPREDIVEVVMEGLATPANVIVPPMMEFFLDDDFVERIENEYTGQNPDRGVELIEEGFDEEGISAPHETTLLTRNPDEWSRSAEIIQLTLEDTGLFDIELTSTDAASWSDRVGDGEAARRNEIMHTGITGSPSPWEYFNRIVTESGIPPACCNYGEWVHPRMEELLDETARTFDREERKPMYEEMMELVASEAPRALLYWRDRLNAVTEDVTDWTVFYDEAWQFTTIYSPHTDTYITLDR